MTGASKI